MPTGSTVTDGLDVAVGVSKIQQFTKVSLNNVVVRFTLSTLDYPDFASKFNLSTVIC